MVEKSLYLKFGGRLVEQLGAQLYPRVTASVAELVSNAWDADAKNAWITIPFDDEWDYGARIEVLDDGNGMTFQQAQDHYLVVGRNRRLNGGDRSEGGRPLHGRKGIGKLAAFGTAGYLECTTLRDGVTTAFGIDYDKLREHDPNDPYEVELVENPEPLLDPKSGAKLEHGTRVRLTRLKAKRRTGEQSFRRSMERRFSLDANKMRVFVNGDPLKRFNTPVDIRFPRDGVPLKASIEVSDDGWAIEEIPYPTEDDPDATREVRWWLGFTKTPIPDEDMRGVSILARGKLAQRPFMFERALGTTGQLGQEYLIGEVSADWLDHGTRADEDLIQSNRDQLQLDNAELERFMRWGRDLLSWALAQRNRVRRDQNVGPGALGTEVEQVLSSAPAGSRERLRTLAGRIAEVTEADNIAVAKAVRAVVDASDASMVGNAASNLALDADPDDPKTWLQLDEAKRAVTPALRSLYQARRESLARFLQAVNEPPVPNLHREVSVAPWIISPILAQIPSREIASGEHFMCFEFDPMPPVLGRLRVLCWEVGLEAEGETIEELTPDLAIATKVEDELISISTWPDILEMSASAHDEHLRWLGG